MKAQLLLTTLGLVFLTACAGLPGDTSAQNDARKQSIKVDLLGSNGKAIQGATCNLSNDFGFVLAQSGQSALVQRSARDLEIRCEAPGLSESKARLLARGNATTVNQGSPNISGHIGLGSYGSSGGVGIGMGFPIGGYSSSSNTTSSYRYPDWVQLQVGKTMLFDAAGSSAGQPAIGYIKP